MDKNTYETYEYLSTNSESDTDQFFVVQDDGTFLSKSVFYGFSYYFSPNTKCPMFKLRAS